MAEKKVQNQDYYDTLEVLTNIAKQYPLLTKADEQALAKKYFKRKPKYFRQLLFNHNVRIVMNQARRYVNRTSDPAALLMSGCYGLMVAADRFDPTRNIKFNTYATAWVFKYIIANFYSKSPVVGVNAISLNTILDSGDGTGIELGDLLFSSSSTGQVNPRSKLSATFAPVVDVDGPQSNDSSSPSDECAENDLIESIQRIYGQMCSDKVLTIVEQKVIELHVMGGYTLKKVSTKLRIPVSQVSLAKRSALSKCKQVFSQYKINE